MRNKKFKNFIIMGYVVLVAVFGGIYLVMEDIGIVKYNSSYRIAISIFGLIAIAAIYYIIDKIKRDKRLKRRKKIQNLLI